MDVSTALKYVVLGAILGMVGQCARTIVGIKKGFDSAKETDGSKKSFNEWFDFKQLILSLIIGGVAGAIACIGADVQVIDRKFMLGIMAAGYAGSDFIEGFMTKALPNKTV